MSHPGAGRDLSVYSYNSKSPGHGQVTLIQYKHSLHCLNREITNKYTDTLPAHFYYDKIYTWTIKNYPIWNSSRNGVAFKNERVNIKCTFLFAYNQG